MKNRIVIFPCSIWKSEAVSVWLHDMAESGWEYRSSFWCFARFCQTLPQEKNYVLTRRKVVSEKLTKVGNNFPNVPVYESPVPLALQANQHPSTLWALFIVLLYLLYCAIEPLIRPPFAEFPVEALWDWGTLMLFFVFFVALLGIINLLPYLFSCFRNSRYGTLGKIKNIALILCVILVCFLRIFSFFYSPAYVSTSPMLWEQSEEAYISEKAVPFGHCVRYTEHLSDEDALRIADYSFWSETISDIFFDTYCKEEDLSSDIFSQNTDGKLQIAFDDEKQLVVVQCGEQVVRFMGSTTSPVAMETISAWLDLNVH